MHLLVYSIIPSVTLLLSYCVYSRWAAYLFLQEGKKQAMFMLFTVMVYQFGCYAAAMDSFLLFFKGYGGAAYRAGVILPYVLSAGQVEKCGFMPSCGGMCGMDSLRVWLHSADCHSGFGNETGGIPV